MLTLITGFKAFSALALISESATGHCCNLAVCRLKTMDLDDHLLSLYHISVSLYHIFLYSLCIQVFTAYCTVLRGIIIRIFVFPKKRLAI